MANGQNGRSNWPFLGGLITIAIGGIGLFQFAISPQNERIIAISGRLDEAVRSANVRLDEKTTSDQRWRADFAVNVRDQVVNAAAQVEERRARDAQRQAEINADFRQAIGEVSGRFNRFMEERGQLLGEAFALRKQLQDHVVSLDRQIQELKAEIARLPDGNCSQAGSCAPPFGPR